MKNTTEIGLMKTAVTVFSMTGLFTVLYLITGIVLPQLPTLLIFCILGGLFLMPVEWFLMLRQSKKDYGKYSLKSALIGQDKQPIIKTLFFAFVLFGVAGIFSITIQPLENMLLFTLRERLLSFLPIGFDWNNIEYIKSFPKNTIMATCAVYFIFNVFAGPITEELFFRGYLSSHYNKQTAFTPILIAILFSLYHFWLPFNNVFRILVFAPVAYVAYKKKNIYISMLFHCMCNLISVVGFILEVL